MAFYLGAVSSDSHPGLGGRNARYDDLQLVLQNRIVALLPTETFAQANFFPASADRLPPGVMQPLLVAWSGAS
jgi:hypothetical protein